MGEQGYDFFEEFYGDLNYVYGLVQCDLLCQILGYQFECLCGIVDVIVWVVYLFDEVDYGCLYYQCYVGVLGCFQVGEEW